MSDQDTTVHQAIRRALDESLADDPRVLLMGEDIGVYGGAFGVTAGLLDKYGPARVRETPISEAGMLGLAVGAALMGLRPVVEFMFMDFMALAMDQLANHAAKFSYIYGGQTGVPLVIRAPFGAGRGYGASHSQSLEAWLVHVPGLKVVAPATPADAYALLKAAIRDPNPVVFLEHKLVYGRKGALLPQQDGIVDGRSTVVRRGEHVTLAGYAYQTIVLLEVAEELSRRGVSAEVVDIPVLKPLNLDAVVQSVRKTHRAIVVEEGSAFCSVGSEISQRLYAECFGDLHGPIAKFSGQDTPIAAAMKIEEAYLPRAAAIVACAESMVRNSGLAAS